MSKKFPQSRTANQSHFAEAVRTTHPRSTFLRNSTLKTTFNAGDIVPIYVDEILPGDTFEMKLRGLIRMQTAIFPTMDDLVYDVHAWYCPSRILWDGWEELHAENKTGMWDFVDSEHTTRDAAKVPVFNTYAVDYNTIGGYMGLPKMFSNWTSGNPQNTPLNALPFRAYGLIWNEWYRDQNTQAPLIIDMGDEQPNTGESGLPVDQNYRRYAPQHPLLKANKKHDYFTTCLPQPQKGAPVMIPLPNLIPVQTGDVTVNNNANNPTPLVFKNLSGGLPGGNSVGLLTTTGQTTSYNDSSNVSQGVIAPTNLFANGAMVPTSALGGTINDLKYAFQLQRLFYKDAIGGTRYQEMLKMHFGVEALDYRLQRPEFLGSYSNFVEMFQVAQTSSTDSESPQGNLSAFSQSLFETSLFNKSFAEHGYIMIFMVIRSYKTYQFGVDKMWTRRDRFDFYYPSLHGIGEQPVYRREIFNPVNGVSQKDDVFGYQEPWADYRFKTNKVTGQFRSDAQGSLDSWHYADYYNGFVFLDGSWMTDNTQSLLDRTLAVTSANSHQFLLDCKFLCKASREMAVHSIPHLADHF